MPYYTQEQYKDFVNQFAAENPKDEKITTYSFFWESDIFSLNSQELMELVVAESLKNSTQVLMLLTVRKILKDFFKWCVDKKIISYNICDAEEYSFSIWYDYAIDRIPLKIYYPEDIDRLIKNSDNFQAEMVLRMFYEGVQSKKDIASIKVSDIHLDEKYIDIKDYRINISDQLAEAIKKYLNTNTFKYTYENRVKGTEKDIHQYEDYLIKSTSEYEDFNSYYLYVKYYIYYQLGLLAKDNNIEDKISIFDIYASGFINFIREDCIAKGKDDVYFSKILQMNSDRYIQARTTEYAKAYGIKTLAPRVRTIYYPYVKRSRYYKQ